MWTIRTEELGDSKTFGLNDWKDAGRTRHPTEAKQRGQHEKRGRMLLRSGAEQAGQLELPAGI